MKIVCDSCGAKYSIADEKVAGKIFKIRCKKCSSVLEVRGDQPAQAFDDGSSAQDPGGEAVWYIVVDGEQKGPFPPIQLSQLFAKGSAGLDSYVWKEGFDDWKVAGDVPDLAQVFGSAAAQTRNAQAAGTDDTSAFGAGGDLFSEGSGREPTSEIEPGSGMFAGFEESPTPQSQDRMVAAAAPETGAGLSGDFGSNAMGASTPQRMTGQRNENSVLFSLSNLQQLASRSGSPAESAPMPSTPSSGAQRRPSQAAGEGSGLIDIRALAKSTTPGTRAAPSEAVDDLLAIGAGGGAGVLGAPLLGPTPLETSAGNRWLWIGGAAIAVIAIIGAGIGVGMALGGADDDTLEITANRPVPTSNQVATVAQVPTEPAQQELAAAAPAEAATLEEPAEAEAARQIEQPQPERRASSTSPQRRARPERSAEAPTPAPEPKKRGGNNLDALMDEVVGGSPAKPKETSKSSSTSTSDSSLPDAPTRDDVKTALQGVSGAVKSCSNGAGGTATVDVSFSGKTGRATSAKVSSGPFKGTPAGSCIESAVKRARVPRFKASSFKVTFPYRL
ncbi:MAG: zinc-ribbon domain-containing protein [Myxococcales bacterium]|nr:zinc-ribbon domain-containing protein [Myxococcales bacterium]